MNRTLLAVHAHPDDESTSTGGTGTCPPAEFAEALGVEDFIRARDTTGSPVPETDLFAGL